jgi:hypothetical protein
MKKSVMAVALVFGCSSPGFCADDPGGPKIDDMIWQTEGSACFAQRKGQNGSDAAAMPLVLVSFPSPAAPFGMRFYIKIDGAMHALAQIAFAHQSAAVSIHFRTLGDRAYDVRLDIGGLTAGQLRGGKLAGSLEISRFGLFSHLPIEVSCAPAAN